MMNIRKTLCLCGLTALSMGVAAESAPSGEALGQIEGIRAVCSRVKPDEAAKYDELVKTLTGDAPEKALAEVRQKPEYHRVYQSVLSEAAQGKNEQVADVCNKFLEMGQPRELESKAAN